jgi:transcriptional regulator with GAF, ATPase, and Fis domain
VKARDLQRYQWPGNVRELRNVIERAVILATGRQLVVAAPQAGHRPMPQTAMTLSQLEVEHIRAVLTSTGWRVRGSGGAAERLGLKPTTLESRMARLGIARSKAS